MKKSILAVFVLTAALTTGCASIVSDSRYPVAISSTPSNSTFVITDKKGKEIHSGTTPTTVSLKSGAGFFSSAKYTVTFNQGSAQEKSFDIKANMDGWYWGNILIGGLIGILIVDPATGAMWKLPNSQEFDLAATAAAPQKGELKVVSIDDISEDQRLNLVRLN